MAEISHKQLLASLSAHEREQLTARTNRQGLLSLAIHVGLILFLSVLIGMQVPGWMLLLLPQGILLVFLFTLMHEVTHRTAFSSVALNKFLAAACGWLLLLPPNWFRYFHSAHHRFTQQPEKDPELQHPKPATRLAYCWYISGVPVTCGNITTIARNAMGKCRDEFVPPASRERVARESRLMIVGYVAVLLVLTVSGSLYTWFVCWLVPMIVGQPFLRLYLLAEHGDCPFVDNMFANTRTVFTNRLIRQLAWNMPYHAEHHAYPNVPFHRLPALHKLVRERLNVTSNGYLEFHREVLRTIKAP